MQAILKVVGGKNDGREIKVNVPEFIIGRGETAHLKPSSDLISREHCAIRLKDGKVEIEDLGSRNGSFVNDQQLTAVHQAKSGDRLRVGRLCFEVVIDPVKPSNKKPKVKDVADVAARTAEKSKEGKPEDLDSSISDWLADEDDIPLGGFGTDETVQFSLDDVEAIKNQESEKPKVDEVSAEQDAESVDADEEDEDGKKKKKKKKEFGKLPTRPKFSHDDSTSAAGDVLKKFFNRR